MRTMTLSLLGAAAIGAMSIGSASAMPFSSGLPALGESHVQDVRIVCDRFGRCYNTNRRSNRSRTYYAPRHYNSGYYNSGYNSYNSGYYGGPRYRAYNRGPTIGIGVGPLGIGIF